MKLWKRIQKRFKWDDYVHGNCEPFDKAKTKYTDGDNT